MLLTLLSQCGNSDSVPVTKHAISMTYSQKKIVIILMTQAPTWVVLPIRAPLGSPIQYGTLIKGTLKWSPI